MTHSDDTLKIVTAVIDHARSLYGIGLDIIMENDQEYLLRGYAPTDLSVENVHACQQPLSKSYLQNAIVPQNIVWAAIDKIVADLKVKPLWAAKNSSISGLLSIPGAFAPGTPKVAHTVSGLSAPKPPTTLTCLADLYADRPSPPKAKKKNEYTYSKEYTTFTESIPKVKK
jgi:hypothetical protein